MTRKDLVKMAAAEYSVAFTNKRNSTTATHDFRQLATAMLEVGDSKVKRILHEYLHGLLDSRSDRARSTAVKVFLALWLIDQPLDVRLPKVALELIWQHGHDLDRQLVAVD